MRFLKLIAEGWNREVTQVDGRIIRLQFRDLRSSGEREKVDAESAIKSAIGMLEGRPGNSVERLVAEELRVVGAAPTVPLWRSALCGVGGGYLAPFDAPFYAMPAFLALEFYAAAGVSRKCREQGIHTMDDIAHLQSIASLYEEHLMNFMKQLPEELRTFIRQLRRTVPSEQAPKDLSDVIASFIMRLLRR